MTGTPMSTSGPSTLGSIAGDDPFASAGKNVPSLEELSKKVDDLTSRVEALESGEKNEGLGAEPEAEDAIGSQKV